MKKLICALLILAVPVLALAGSVDPAHKENGQTIYMTQQLSLSANASAQSLGSNLIGGYLFSVEIFASADDAVVFSIASALGTTIFTRTTTAATSGEIANPTGYWPINDTPTYTLSGLGSGTVTVEITVAKR